MKNRVRQVPKGRVYFDMIRKENIDPVKPQGDKAKNWIPTEEGRAWFPYFRLYSPKKAFLDRTWVLPDIEKVK